MKKHILAFSYVLFAGIIPTLVLLYLGSRTLALLEEYEVFLRFGIAITALMLIIGPVLGSWLFWKIKAFANISSNFWKYTIVYSVVFAILSEIQSALYEPIWSGTSVIFMSIIGTVLSVITYRKVKAS